jgi:hypothetical protein
MQSYTYEAVRPLLIRRDLPRSTHLSRSAKIGENLKVPSAIPVIRDRSNLSVANCRCRENRMLLADPKLPFESP